MKFNDLTVLLPCHSLEDFPVYHEGSSADELLTAWCTLWHPALLASAGVVPNWERIDIPPENLSGRLISVPPFCADRLPAGFVARAKNEGALVVRQNNLSEAVSAALGAVDGGAAGVDDELAADFVALGYCRLQIELLTRQMRYSTNIDETHFNTSLIAAASAAVAGDVAAAREQLAACFETLNEARKHVYPVDIYLLDVTLLAPTTLAAGLARELATGLPANYLQAISVLERLSRDEPENWRSLLSAIDAGNACLLGNEVEESELPLLPCETTLEHLRAGCTAYERLIGRRPRVFGRRRFGLWPLLPEILSRLGYLGALHFTLDDGRFPLGPQCKTRWEGLDTSVLDIFARVPTDAARPESFLSLSRQIADSMDHDHVATLALAHWPAASSPWYDVLRRVARQSPALGKFTLMDDYFSHTDMPGRLSKFEPDEYRTPYLQQAVIRKQADPLSRCVREHVAQAARASSDAISTIADLINGRSTPGGKTETADSKTALRHLAAALPRDAGQTGQRALVVNPLSFSRRIGVELPGFTHPPRVGGPVVASAAAGDHALAVVEVPAMGFAWVEPAAEPAPASRAKPIAQENVLRNEFFEVTISRGTGGIQSLYSFTQRGNQLSQQLAFRLPASEPDNQYTSMQAESVEVTRASTVCGEITSRGALVDAAGKRFARFRQTVQAWVGSRVLRIEIELEDVEEPRSDPWNSYYAARFAWPIDSADLRRGVALTRQPTETPRLEAPEYIDIEGTSGCITLLTGGLPYHRRSDSRMLDTMLVVRGESARRFVLGIGVDLPQPAAASLELISPATVLSEETGAPKAASGWFFHLDAKNVVATHWSPLLAEPSGASGGDDTLPVRGFRARLVETAGRSGRVTLRTFRAVAAARQVDFLGDPVLELRVEDDRITLDFAACEWIEIEAVWK